MDFSSFDDKLFQDLNLDFGLPCEDPFANISEMNLGDFLGADMLRDFSELPASSSPPAAQLPEQPTCYDDFDSVGAAFSPPSNPPSFRSSMSSKQSELSDAASPPSPPTRLRPAPASQRPASLAPKLHPTFAASPALSDARSPSLIGVRGCPKRHRKTIQIKRQEQQSRLDTLNTRHTKLQEAVRLASSEVSIARQTLYNVLKTARQGNLDAFSPAP